jgi:predicted metal-dependent phosphoesterase TrpH
VKHISKEDARGWAASAWCGSGKAIDLDIAKEFAEILERRVDEAVESKEFRDARDAVARHLQDEGLRQAYVANIAMLLYDRFGVDRERVNPAAEQILDLIFKN